MSSQPDAIKTNPATRLALLVVAAAGVAAIGCWLVAKVSTRMEAAGAAGAIAEVAAPADGSEAAAVALADAPKYGQGDWPAWRGVAGDNSAIQAKVPSTWGEKENVKWHVALPGRRHSTPIVLGDRMFVTTALEDQGQVLALALDKKTGKELWRSTVFEGKFRAIHQSNSHATSTPISDGQRLYVAALLENTVSLAALSLDKGKLLWSTDCGPCTAKWGFSGSLAFWRGLLFVAVDNPDGGWIAAFAAKDGKPAWRKKRAKVQEGSYSSPIVATIEGVPQVIMTGGENVTGYDPASGKILWSHDGLPSVTVGTTIVAGNLCFATGGYPAHKLVALRLKPTADAKKMTSEFLWETEKSSEVPYIPTAVYHAGKLLVMNDQGVLMSRDATTGEIDWKRRLGGNFNASPLVLGDKLLVSNDIGAFWLIELGSGEIAAENTLPAGMHASPIVSDDALVLRTDEGLYCVEAKR